MPSHQTSTKPVFRSSKKTANRFLAWEVVGNEHLMTKRYRQFPANMMDEFYVNGQANTNKILSVRKLPNVRF
jgi:hypothetical protein